MAAEFGFRVFTAKTSEFCRGQESSAQNLLGALSLVRGAISDDALTPMTEAGDIQSGLAKAAAAVLSLLVREQLSVDACARTFALTECGFGTACSSLSGIVSPDKCCGIDWRTAEDCCG
jgi:hypothetical protein